MRVAFFNDWILNSNCFGSVWQQTTPHGMMPWYLVCVQPDVDVIGELCRSMMK